MSHDANSVINGTYHFCLVQIIKMMCNITFFGHVIHLVLALAFCDADSIVNGRTATVSSRWSKWGEMWCFGHVVPLALVLELHDTNGIKNDTTAIFTSRQLKYDATWQLGHWHHMVPLASRMASLQSLNQDNWNEMQHDSLVMWCHWHWHQCHMIPTTSSMAPLHSLH